MRKINQAGLDLIKSFEGFKPKMYICPAGLPTIGYGTVIDTVEEQYLKTKTLTQQEANDLLAKELGFYEKEVAKLITKTITDNQFAALVSFAFNCGVGNLRKSTLLKRVNQNPNDFVQIKAQFNLWNKANGKVLAGLTRRREAEAKLYFTNETAF